MRDSVDAIVEQWNRERPELDTGSMALVGRLLRINALLRRDLDANFARHDLGRWEFDVLGTLRRSGPPFRLSVSDLVASMMIASGTMTNRLDRLERRGLLARQPDPNDRRCVLVQLTDEGRALIDDVIVTHVATLDGLVSTVDEGVRDELSGLLRGWLLALGDDLT